jgi:hypothetical protein
MAYKLLFVAFIITTSLGALTGVGIWFAAALANPASIGSLIRVFYFMWFAEWIIFVLEVVFIMVYFLTWKKANKSPKRKRKHILFGAGLSIFSWLTLAIIVGILGFMMEPGSWTEDKTLIPHWCGSNDGRHSGADDNGLHNETQQPFPRIGTSEYFHLDFDMDACGCRGSLLLLLVYSAGNARKPAGCHYHAAISAVVRFGACGADCCGFNRICR